MDVHQQIARDYREDLSRLDLDEQTLTKYNTIYSFVRLFVFLITITLVILFAQFGSIISISTALTGMLTFLLVVRRHHMVEREREFVRLQKEITENELSFLKDRVNQNYDGSHFMDQGHHYSTDLDVFGPFSLYAQINRCRTYTGMNLLSEFLSDLPTIEKIRERTDLIQEIEKDKLWRNEFLASLYEVNDGQNLDVAKVVNSILSTDFLFATKSGLTFYRRILPLIWIAIIGTYFFASNWAILMAIVTALVNFKITLGYANKVTNIQYRLSRAGNYLDKYAMALEKIYNRSWQHPPSEELSKTVNLSANLNKVEALSSLKKIADLLDYRLHMIPSFLLNVGVLWDSRIVARLANWQQKNQFVIDGVFELIGRVEALTSLGIWSYNHPHYSYPSLDTNYFHFRGINLRHPLIAHEGCIPNDFHIDQGNYINIITGSNMSGKSTFLRTLGLNLVLGYAGTRVSASHLSYSIAHLFTYMRIKDALEENVSTFKAELNRIAKILEMMKAGIPVLILADEMLRGTNSKDKLEGSKAIIRKILTFKSYAIVATHDIGLTNPCKFNPGEVRNYFFDIDYADGELLFDYKIKTGICENFNASFLLNQLGIDVSNNYSVET